MEWDLKFKTKLRIFKVGEVKTEIYHTRINTELSEAKQIMVTEYRKVKREWRK